MRHLFAMSGASGLHRARRGTTRGYVETAKLPRRLRQTPQPRCDGLGGPIMSIEVQLCTPRYDMTTPLARPAAPPTVPHCTRNPTDSNRFAPRRRSLTNLGFRTNSL